MPSPEAALGILDRCAAALRKIGERRRQKDERADRALFALYAALNETKAYAETLDAHEKRDRNRELAIARLWHDASIPLRHVDRDLADRCFLKGSYWMEPDVWTDIKIRRKGIKLYQLLESTRDLLLRV